MNSRCVREIIKAIPYLVFLILAPLTSAVSQDATCRRGTTVIFVNGVLNDYTAAYLSFARARDAYSRAVPAVDGEVVTFKLAYNKTQSYFDFVESVAQLLGQQESPTTIRAWLEGASPPPVNIQGALVQMIGLLVGQLNGAENITKHVSMYKAAVAAGDRVILISHSQGGLFANSSYDRLTAEEKKYLAIVAVATPAASVRGDDASYVTVDRDLVIGLVPGARPWNVENGFNLLTDDWSGHQFLPTYLNRQKPARSAIETLIRRRANALPFPADESETCGEPPDDPPPPPPPPPVSGEIVCSINVNNQFVENVATGLAEDEESGSVRACPPGLFCESEVLYRTYSYSGDMAVSGGVVKSGASEWKFSAQSSGKFQDDANFATGYRGVVGSVVCQGTITLGQPGLVQIQRASRGTYSRNEISQLLGGGDTVYIAPNAATSSSIFAWVGTGTQPGESIGAGGYPFRPGNRSVIGSAVDYCSSSYLSREPGFCANNISIDETPDDGGSLVMPAGIVNVSVQFTSKLGTLLDGRDGETKAESQVRGELAASETIVLRVLPVP